MSVVDHARLGVVKRSLRSDSRPMGIRLTATVAARVTYAKQLAVAVTRYAGSGDAGRRCIRPPGSGFSSFSCAQA